MNSTIKIVKLVNYVNYNVKNVNTKDTIVLNVKKITSSPLTVYPKTKHLPARMDNTTIKENANVPLKKINYLLLK